VEQGGYTADSADEAGGAEGCAAALAREGLAEERFAEERLAEKRLTEERGSYASAFAEADLSEKAGGYTVDLADGPGRHRALRERLKRRGRSQGFRGLRRGLRLRPRRTLACSVAPCYAS